MTDQHKRVTPTLGRMDERVLLAECAASFADAKQELWAAEASRDRARRNRARIAIDRLRQRYDWLASRTGAN